MTFLKWVGGKSKLLPEILSRIDEIPNKEDKTYFEPFLGSGIVLQNIIRKYKFKSYVVSDINPILIETHKCIKDNVDDLIECLEMLSVDTTSQAYYSLREVFNDSIVHHEFTPFTCALFIYLNHTCFRGLYRVNKDGMFNTPYGNYNNPRIFNEQQLRELSDLYNSVDIEFYNCSYEEIDFGIGNVLYLDPPYLLSFDNYNNKSFNQNRLDYVLFLLSETRSSNFIILSDNDKFHEDINKYFKCKTVTLQDRINSKNPGSTRTEILADNFEWCQK